MIFSEDSFWLLIIFEPINLVIDKNYVQTPDPK